MVALVACTQKTHPSFCQLLSTNEVWHQQCDGNTEINKSHQFHYQIRNQSLKRKQTKKQQQQQRTAVVRLCRHGNENVNELNHYQKKAGRGLRWHKRRFAVHLTESTVHKISSIICHRTTLFIVYKNFAFPTGAEWSYLSADFGVKIFL